MNTADITALAESLAKQYNPHTVAPFPYHNLLKDHHDLEIVYADLEDDVLSGAILFKDAKFTILINTTKSEHRQHFTLGHELGHYFLHQDIVKAQKGVLDEGVWLDNPTALPRLNSEPRIEIEANIFALSLLMPQELVSFGWGLTQNIEELAETFKVSTVAMSLRLTHLGLVK